MHVFMVKDPLLVVAHRPDLHIVAIFMDQVAYGRPGRMRNLHPESSTSISWMSSKTSSLWLARRMVSLY